MNTQIHIPTASHLREYVTGIWETSSNQNIQEIILPQGIVEMVFNLGDPMHGLLPHGANTFNAPRCFIQGVNTQIVQVNYSGQQHLLGVRLQPGMVKALLGIFPSELKNTLIDLTLIKPGFSILWHELKEAKTFEEKVKLIEDELPVLSTAICHRTQKLCNLFLADGIQNFESLDKLSQEIYFSPRHLSRKAQSLFGISAEELITYKKFLHAVKLMHLNNESLTEIAYEAGFYDQAHFCRIFKSYSGITPKQYRQQKSCLPFHLFSQA